MKKMVFVLLVFPFLFARSQQDSKIVIDSGKGNNISLTQEDSSKSDINIKRGDSNKLNIKQKGKPLVSPEVKPGGFKEFISNTNNVFIMLISIATFIGLAYKARGFFQKNKKK